MSGFQITFFTFFLATLSFSACFLIKMNRFYLCRTSKSIPFNFTWQDPKQNNNTRRVLQTTI